MIRLSMSYALRIGVVGATLLSLGACEPVESPAADPYQPVPYVKIQHPEWSKDAAIYQVNTRQFTPEGTFRAAAEELPRLRDLGVNIIWLMPVHEIGELTINISGCMNACGHHHVGHIGILGVDKKGQEFYQFTLGGSSDENASLGDRTGPGFPADQAVNAVETILNTYISEREEGERFLDTYRRIGMAPFKEALYGPA